MLNFSKLCQKCIFLHCSKILRRISCKNVQYFNFANAHKPKLDFFCRTVPIFFLAALLFVFLCFLILSTFYTVHPFFWPEKFRSLASNEKFWKGHHDQFKYRYIGLFYHQFCTKNWSRFFRLALSDCSRSSKWTVLWKDLSNRYTCSPRICWRANSWRHKWLNGHFSKSRNNPDLAY